MILVWLGNEYVDGSGSYLIFVGWDWFWVEVDDAKDMKVFELTPMSAECSLLNHNEKNDDRFKLTTVFFRNQSATNDEFVRKAQFL